VGLRLVVSVIINASAGTVAKAESRLAPAAVEEAFRVAGVHPEIHYVDGAEIGQHVRAALQKRPEAIVVGGGDGTLSTAAGILADTGVRFGVLPFGTLNHFSKDLQIPDDLSQAVAVIAEGNVRQIDVAEVNGQVFLNNCSIGAYPVAVRRRDELRKYHGHGKWRAMTLAWIEVLRDLRRFPVMMTLDGRPISRRTPLVLISNNRYAASLFSRNLREQMDTGELWVYTTRCHRVFPLVRLIFAAALGRMDEAKGFESWPAKDAAVVLAGTSVKLGMDGEVSEFQLPLRFRSRPGALLVLAPSPKK